MAIQTATLTTTESDIYTCPGGQAAWVYLIQVTNIDGSNAVDIDIAVQESGGAKAYLIKGGELVAGDTRGVVAGGLKLSAGDKIRARASANGDADIVISYGEHAA